MKRKKNNVLLVGNGINNLTNKQSWKDLLSEMVNLCGVNNKVELNEKKPFPLLYEEIYLMSKDTKEFELKKLISKEIQKISENAIHDLIRNCQFQDIITTNYDYVIQGFPSAKIKNNGVIKETKYNIFRHNNCNGTRYWHIHGECNIPDSITLGYEHYGGQLQQIRNYVVSGTNYIKKKNQESLSKRIRKSQFLGDSWLELFFTKNIHIIGLALDFVETDLWWLLTYRARLKRLYDSKIRNKISYYIPTKYKNGSKHKLDLLKSVNVNVMPVDMQGELYYRHVVEYVKLKVNMLAGGISPAALTTPVMRPSQ